MIMIIYIYVLLESHVILVKVKFVVCNIPENHTFNENPNSFLTLCITHK